MSMRFKQYLQELTSIETGQAIVAHEPTEMNSSSISNPRVISEINTRLLFELSDVFLSPEAGVQKIRKVLHRFGLDMPALYQANPEGDEFVLDMKQFGFSHGPDVHTGSYEQKNDSNVYLYVIYYLTDEGRYEFFAEAMYEDELNDFISGEEEDEEEEN
jgi:hypothetical protein